VEASHVLLAMGLGEEQAHSSIRIGCGRFNTEKEIILATNTIRLSVESLLRIKCD